MVLILNHHYLILVYIYIVYISEKMKLKAQLIDSLTEVKNLSLHIN